MRIECMESVKTKVSKFKNSIQSALKAAALRKS